MEKDKKKRVVITGTGILSPIGSEPGNYWKNLLDGKNGISDLELEHLSTCYTKKYGLLKAYIVAILARGAFHVLGGYLYWMDYMPDNFPKSLTALYPIIYNYSYILLEGVLTIAVISIPAVSSALGRMRVMATGGNRQPAVEK